MTKRYTLFHSGTLAVHITETKAINRGWSSLDRANGALEKTSRTDELKRRR